MNKIVLVDLKPFAWPRLSAFFRPSSTYALLTGKPSLRFRILKSFLETLIVAPTI